METDMKKLRYWIKNFHPESDSEWFEEETFNLSDKAFDHMIELPEIDQGHGYRQVWDNWKNKPVSKKW